VRHHGEEKEEGEEDCIAWQVPYLLIPISTSVYLLEGIFIATSLSNCVLLIPLASRLANL
jgi:hypothetical protein